MTCGSIIKLYNERQDVRLHSHDVKYGTGSGQQSVTGHSAQGDQNSLWVVRGKNGRQCERGDIIKCGQKIRLQHLATKRNLHSTEFQRSPLSREQEVSAYGDNGEGDDGDNWVVKCKTKYWNRNKQVRFLHDESGRYLHVSSDKFGRPISGQHEICAQRREGVGNQWVAKEGIYVREKKR